MINLWPSIIQEVLKERCLKGTGNVQSVAKKLLSFPLSQQKIDQSIVEIAGEQKDRVDFSNL